MGYFRFSNCNFPTICLLAYFFQTHTTHTWHTQEVIQLSRTQKWRSIIQISIARVAQHKLGHIHTICIDNRLIKGPDRLRFALFLTMKCCIIQCPQSPELIAIGLCFNYNININYAVPAVQMSNANQ